MSTYRVVHDWRITIVRDDDQVVAAVHRDHVELAQRIVRLLNADDRNARRKPTDCPRCGADVPLAPGGVCQACAADMAQEDA